MIDFNKKIFEARIPDQGIRDYILNGRDNPDLDPFNIGGNYGFFFNNIVNLAFMYAFSCYQDLANRDYSAEGDGPLEHCMKSGSANSKRVLANMKKIYNGYAITNELIQYILLDIYFDFELGDDSQLKRIFPHFMSTGADTPLPTIFSIINATAVSSRVKIKLADAREMLEDLIDTFPFVKKARLVFLPEREWYIFKLDKGTACFPKGIVNTFGSIMRVAEVTDLYCYLSDISNNSLKLSKVGYSSFVVCPLKGDECEDNGYSVGLLQEPYDIPRDEEFYYSLLNPDRLEQIRQSGPVYAIEQLFNIKYKYIKNLALAIADTLGRASFASRTDALRAEFEPKFPDAFKKYDPVHKNWDTVVLMLLIETSPSIVLQKIFSLENKIQVDVASRIIKNLTKRFGDEFSIALSKRLYGNENTEISPDAGEDLKRIAERMVKIHTLHDAVVPSYHTLRVAFVAEKMAGILLSAIGSRDDEDLVSFCIGDTKQNIEALEVLKGESNLSEKCKGVYKAFGEFLIKISCFYEGVYAYGEKKLEYIEKSSSKILSSAEIRAHQQNAEDAFRSGAEAKYKKICEQIPEGELLPIIKEFISTCESCCSIGSDNKTYTLNKDSHSLYGVLGKNNIIDISLFREHANFKELPELSESTVDGWITRALSIIKFFRTGSFESKDMNINLFSAITPFIASYNKGNDNKDGYHTAMFSLVFNASDTPSRQHEVNVLSEFDYNMNSKYYCLPNIVTSTDKWWIDPFIIKCQVFDEIFEKR